MIIIVTEKVLKIVNTISLTGFFLVATDFNTSHADYSMLGIKILMLLSVAVWQIIQSHIMTPPPQHDHDVKADLNMNFCQHNILSSALQYKVTWYQQPTGTNMALCMYIYANPLHDNPTGTQWLVMLSGGLKQPLPSLHNDKIIFILPYLSDSNIPLTMSHQHYTTWPPWLTMWHHDADRFLRLFDVVGGQTTVCVATHELLPLVVPGHWAQSLQHTQKKDTLQQRKKYTTIHREQKYTLQHTEKK